MNYADLHVDRYSRVEETELQFWMNVIRQIQTCLSSDNTLIRDPRPLD